MKVQSPRKQRDPVTVYYDGELVDRNLYVVVSDHGLDFLEFLPTWKHPEKFQVFVGDVEVKDIDYDSDGHSHWINTFLELSAYSEENSVILPYNASKILETGSETLTQRAKLRDSTSTGERSMAKAVAIFNAWQGDTGDHLTEEEGWRFMIALKQARMAGGRFHLDDYVDLASYSALLGEHLGDLNASSQET